MTAQPKYCIHCKYAYSVMAGEYPYLACQKAVEQRGDSRFCGEMRKEGAPCGPDGALWSKA